MKPPGRAKWQREAAVLVAALALIAAAVYGPHAIHGGFISDSWFNRSTYVFGSSNGPLDAFDAFFAYPNFQGRPLFVTYLVGLNTAFGSHMGFWLGWLIGTSVLMSACVHLLLRRMGFAPLHAGLIAVLILIFPAADSLRLWAAVVQAPATIALAALGFVLALSAFDAAGKRGLRLHFASLALFVASLLLYEVALPVMLASVLLYRLRVPWRPALSRWMVDCAVLVPLALLVTGSSSNFGQTQDLAGAVSHAKVIYDQALTLFATSVLPFDFNRWLSLGLAALPPAAAMVRLRRAAPDEDERAELRRWLLAAAAGLLVMILGYAAFVPGIDYYQPLATGIANRVNGVAGIGWVLFLYAEIMLAVTVALRRFERPRALASGAAAVACLVVGVSWVQPIVRDSDDYTRAFTEGQKVLAVLGSSFPNPPPHSTVWTFGQPVEVVPGIPVFGNTWDMTASVQLLYGDPTIESYVGFPGTRFQCERGLITPSGPHYPDLALNTTLLASGYGSTYFIDSNTGRLELIRTPAQCRRAAAAFPRSPPLPLTTG